MKTIHKQKASYLRRRILWLFTVLLVLLPALGLPAAASEAAFEGIFNFREVSGYTGADGKKIKEGLIYRSGELGAATEADLAMLETLGLEVVFDLRTKTENTWHPDNVPEGTEVLSVPMKEKEASRENVVARREKMQAAAAEGTALEKMAQRAGPCSYKYTKKLFDTVIAQKGYAKMLRRMIKTKGKSAVLFHCVHGKDRTGTSVAVVMFTLGCSRGDVVREYKLTNKAKRKILGKDAEDAVSVSQFKKVLTYVENKWGSWERYIRKGIGLTRKEIKKLRKYYLE